MTSATPLHQKPPNLGPSDPGGIVWLEERPGGNRSTLAESGLHHCVCVGGGGGDRGVVESRR